MTLCVPLNFYLCCLILSIYVQVCNIYTQIEKWPLTTLGSHFWYMLSRDGTKPIASTRSIGCWVNFKISESPKNPIPTTFQYYFDTFLILYIHVYNKNAVQ